MNDAARFDAARDAAFDAALARIVARFEALGAADVARLGGAAAERLQAWADAGWLHAAAGDEGGD